MALEDKIEAVKKVSKALETKTVPEQPLERVAPNKEHFQSLMNAEDQKYSSQRKIGEPVAVEKTQPQSLMEEVRKLNTSVDHLSQITPNDLKNQAGKLIAQIDQVKTQLANAQEIKPSYQTLLRNRLTHVDDTLKVALSKAGVEYKVPEITANRTMSPIDRFMGYLTQGQYQLEHLNESLGLLSKQGKQLTPSDMLTIQIKVGQIQQELELFTSLLNKALESTKTLMNVQV